MQVIEKVKVVPEGYKLFNAFKEASAKNPSLTYEEFIKTMK